MRTWRDYATRREEEEAMAKVCDERSSTPPFIGEGWEPMGAGRPHHGGAPTSPSFILHSP